MLVARELLDQLGVFGGRMREPLRRRVVAKARRIGGVGGDAGAGDRGLSDEVDVAERSAEAAGQQQNARRRVAGRLADKDLPRTDLRLPAELVDIASLSVGVLGIGLGSSPNDARAARGEDLPRH